MKNVLIIILCIIGGVIGYVLLCVAAAMLSCIFISLKKEYRTDNKYFRFVFNSMTGLSLFLCGVRTEFRGMEKIPTDTRFVLVGNHISNFDPIIQWFKLRKFNMSYISKPENFRIFAFGKLAYRCLFLPIDRKSAKNSVSTFKRAADIITDDQASVGIYPEGTRSKTGELGRFHNSVFKVAQWTNVPIVVVRTSNTNKIHKNVPFKRTKVLLEVVDVMDRDFVAKNPTSEIGERTRAALEGYEYVPKL